MDRHERLTDLFVRASEIESPEERRAWLESECGDDAEMRREVEELLAADAKGVELLDDVESTSLLGLVAAAEDRLIGETIGKYRIHDRIASGGMGTVYLARQESPERDVAIKLMRRGLESDSVRRRFELESQMLARLHHPGIAEVFEAHVASIDGHNVPYFAMEYVRGGLAITDYAERNQFGLRERLELFLQACDAIQHSHQHGVVHRDLKPDNLLVDRDGFVKVIDFGVALAAGDDPRHRATTMTASPRVLGTLSFMSPEQVRGDADEIDTRTDIYALGVILFELLASKSPLDVSGKTLPEAARVICDDAPSRLGTKFGDAHGDLDTICRKALEKDPERRYASAAEFADDLRRHLANEPILARPPTAIYQLRKFARRHRGLVAGLVLATLALVAGSGVALQQAIAATIARDDARERAYRNSIAAAVAALEVHDVGVARRMLDEAPEDLRAWEWFHLSSRLDESSTVIELPGAPETVSAPFFWHRDNQLTVVAATEAGVITWSVPEGRELERIAPAGSLLFSRGDVFATWDVARDQLTVRRGHEATSHDTSSWDVADGSVEAVAIDAAGQRIVWLTASTACRVELGVGAVERVAVQRQQTKLEGIAIDDAGTAYFAAALEERPAVWPQRTQGLQPLDVPSYVRSIDLANGDLLVGLHDRTLRRYDPKTRRVDGTARGHRHAVTGVRNLVSTGRIATVSVDRTVRLWRSDNLELVVTLHGHERTVWHVAADASERWLATTSGDGTLRVWDVATDEAPGVLGRHEGLVFPIAFRHDGRVVASAGWDRTVRLWDVETSKPVQVLPVDADAVLALGFSPDGSRLVALGTGGLVAWRLDTGERLPSRGFDAGSIASCRSVSFADDSVHVPLPWTLRGSRVAVWNTDDGTVTSWSRERVARAGVRNASADGRFVACYTGEPKDPRSSVGDSGNRFEIVDAESGAIRVDDATSGPFAFSPTRPELCAARLVEDLSKVAIFDLHTRERIATLIGHAGAVYSVAFTPDGRRIATGGRDGLRVWDGATYREVVDLRGHGSFVWSVAFRPTDGSQLASGSGDRTVRLWDHRPHGERRAAAR